MRAPNRYTAGKFNSRRRGNEMFAILDRGVTTSALGCVGTISRISDKCEINGGMFYGGVFNDGVFNGGVFRAGVFNGGSYHGGIFAGGVFNGGHFFGGKFYGGEFHAGDFIDGWFYAGNYIGGYYGVPRVEYYTEEFDADGKEIPTLCHVSFKDYQLAVYPCE